MKRAFDIIAGALLALAALPLMIAFAIGSAICLRSWPIFAHQRVGYGGRSFFFLKIRTLPVSVAPYIDKYQLELDSIPRFTRWLRRTHLDELPQLLLVPLGKMSLVGPRPEMEVLHDTMTDAVALERLALRPGCTGLWQISADCDRLIVEAPEYDRFYFRHASVRLDLWIIARTVMFVLFNAAPITLGSVPAWALRQPRHDTADLRLGEVAD